MSFLKLIGKPEPYEKIAAEIEGVPGVVTHGLMLNSARAAVIAYGQEARIVEKVRL